ncbi:hypothetical protein GCM10023107_07260 [Actinoplanes octamycinicus]
MGPGQHLLHDILRQVPVAGEDDRVAQQAGQSGHRELLEGHIHFDASRPLSVHCRSDLFPEPY